MGKVNNLVTTGKELSYRQKRGVRVNCFLSAPLLETKTGLAVPERPVKTDTIVTKYLQDIIF